MTDLVGETFGSWVVLSEEPSAISRKRLVRVKCACGFEQVTQLNNLRNGSSTRCRRCAKVGRTSNRRTHGEATARTPEYLTWKSIQARCLNVRESRYGGRGISVCARWRDRSQGFANFLADMGRRPSADHSIDRINNELGYSPSNCRWATREIQSNNKSTSKLVTVEGVTLTVSQWAKRTGKPASAMYLRLRRGWSGQEVVFGRRKPRARRRLTP